jgi:branched-subunit amino acid aminotransferase/4-amino-4-deoxychorismate lyase
MKIKSLIVCCLLVSAAAAQGPAASIGLVPTAAQHKKLATKRAHIVSLQDQINRLQIEAAYEAQELITLCRRVVLDNRWPADEQCDMNSLSFYEAAPPFTSASQVPAPPASTKPDEKPKP